MLIKLTILFLTFGAGWNFNDRFQEGFIWTVFGKPLNYEDMSRAVWLMGAGLVVAVIARYGEPALKKYKFNFKARLPFLSR